MLPALRDANKQPPPVLQDLGPDPSVSSVQLQNPRMDLEAQIREIAAKEGVTLPRTNPRALTSITIATRRRSSSPSPAASPAPPVSPVPEPLHLTELSAGTVRQPEANGQLLAATEQENDPEPASGRNQILTCRLRQDTVGAQFGEPAPPSQQDDDDTQALRPDVIQLSVQDGSVSAVSHEAQQAKRSSAPESPARSSHVSHVHLTLSPKTGDHSSAPAVRPGHTDAAAGPPHKDFVSLRQTSSPDEGVGLSSPPEWYDSREPMRQRAPERADTSTLLRTAVPHGRLTSTPPRSFKPGHRAVVSPRPPKPDSAGRFSLGETQLNRKRRTQRSLSDDIITSPFLFQPCPFCCLINPAAPRSFSTSLRRKPTSPPTRRTPRWRAATQVRPR